VNTASLSGYINVKKEDPNASPDQYSLEHFGQRHRFECGYKYAIVNYGTHPAAPTGFKVKLNIHFRPP
jgi:hypothetical protein